MAEISREIHRMPGIVGPTIKDLLELDFTGKRCVIASGFYSRTALGKLTIHAKQVDLMVRLDLGSSDEWKTGAIDPEALAGFIDRHQQASIDVKLYVHPIAHAKVYVGRRGFLAGSANLTTRGFSGVGHELLWKESQRTRVNHMMQSLDIYRSRFHEINQMTLQEYIALHKSSVTKFRKRRRQEFENMDEDRVEANSERAVRYGDYESFLHWVGQRTEEGAEIILRRANGESSLSGHIKANFYGLRQWMLFDPDIQVLGRSAGIDTYNLRRDSSEEELLREFVLNHASDEPGFVLSSWRNYLPKECGGRAANRGGTIGNLHRMIPLLARYLP